MYIIVPMPYGCLPGKKLSNASRGILRKALELWENSFRSVRMDTRVVLGAFADESEIKLRKEIIDGCLPHGTDRVRILDLGVARNEETLILKLWQEIENTKCDGFVVFTEATHLTGIKPIFRKCFGSLPEFRVFPVSFEANHPWITARFPFLWRWRNRWISSYYKARMWLKAS